MSDKPWLEVETGLRFTDAEVDEQIALDRQWRGLIYDPEVPLPAIKTLYLDPETGIAYRVAAHWPHNDGRPTSVAVHVLHPSGSTGFSFLSILPATIEKIWSPNG